MLRKQLSDDDLNAHSAQSNEQFRIFSKKVLTNDLLVFNPLKKQLMNYVHNFRILKQNTFYDIKLAACTFWKLYQENKKNQLHKQNQFKLY